MSRIVIEDNKLADSEKVIGSFLLRHPDSLLPLEKNETPLILYDDFQKFRENYIEPNALELLDNFLFYYCHTGKIGQRFQQNKFDITVAVKALDLGMGEWVVKQANSMGWLNVFDTQKTQSGAFSSTFELSAAGWSEFYEKQKNHSSSKQAFLALQFNNEVLRKVIIPEIKSACALAGFELLAVDDRPKAGLIDDKIRVDIRNSRFVVVDISDQNQGAYFEAGFAEGLGKHVFYICDKIEFEKHFRTEKKVKTIHFDVEHQTIIQWDKDNPKSIGEDLLASIRNTLPNEAKMTD